MMMAAMMPEKIGNQPTRHGIPRFGDTYAAEIHSKNIECGVRSATCHATHASYKMNRRPYCFMVSIISPLAPLPLSDFIRAVGRAPTKLVSTPNSPTT